MSAHYVGLALLAAPLLFIDFFILIYMRNRPVFFFGLALTIVGLGYLATTPAPAEIASIFFADAAWIN